MVMAVSAIDSFYALNSMVPAAAGLEFLLGWLATETYTAQPAAADPKVIVIQEIAQELVGAAGANLVYMGMHWTYPIPFVYARREIASNIDNDSGAAARCSFFLWYHLVRVKSAEIIGGFFG